MITKQPNIHLSNMVFWHFDTRTFGYRGTSVFDRNKLKVIIVPNIVYLHLKGVVLQLEIASGLEQCHLIKGLVRIVQAPTVSSRHCFLPKRDSKPGHLNDKGLLDHTASTPMFVHRQAKCLTTEKSHRQPLNNMFNFHVLFCQALKKRKIVMPHLRMSGCPDPEISLTRDYR